MTDGVFSRADALFLGLDFGTESVRVVAVDRRGQTFGAAVRPYPHGQIVPGSSTAAGLFGLRLPPAAALQHPSDWLASAAEATKAAVGAEGSRIAGIGVDFTSCTMLPARSDGTPL